MDLTPDQIARLQSLGISAPAPSSTSTPSSAPSTTPEPLPITPMPSQPQSIPTPDTLSSSLENLTFELPTPTPESIPTDPTTNPTDQNQTNDIKTDQTSSPSLGQTSVQTISSNPETSLLTDKKSPDDSNKNNIVPLLSISGFTILSIGSLIFFKSKDTASITNPPPAPYDPASSALTPTQVPKSIQHYLLTSQQYFTKAVSAQTQDQKSALEQLNQSITLATQAISDFPQDYRGYEQRGRIYQSLIDSQPQFIDQAIFDYSTALKLNPSSADLCHNLAVLFGRKGDKEHTLYYLAQAVTLDPTKPQNFYDLARIQQQAGFLPEALETYDRLLTLVTDPSQSSQLKAEKTALENLISQAGPDNASHLPLLTPTLAALPTVNLLDNPPTLQADSLASNGPIIAAPETNKNIELTGQTDSNALSGTATLTTGQTQISIQNQNLTSASQVYLSVVSGGKNLSFQVLSKSEGSFTAGLDAPSPDDIVFKWWIINP